MVAEANDKHLRWDKPGPSPLVRAKQGDSLPAAPFLDAATEKAAELALWIAAIDTVPVEKRIEWVADKLRLFREVCQMRDSYVRCPTYGEARGTSECEVCNGEIVNCPVYGPSEKARMERDDETCANCMHSRSQHDTTLLLGNCKATYTEIRPWGFDSVRCSCSGFRMTEVDDG